MAFQKWGTHTFSVKPFSVTYYDPTKDIQKQTAAAKPTLSEDIRAAFKRAMEQYAPGGGFGAGTEAALERGRTKAVAGGQQALASAGLAGTTMLAAPGQRFEEETAMPARMGVEEERARRLSDLELALAGAEQRGYESAEEREMRGRTAGGQLGLGYAQLGFEQEQAALEEIHRRKQEELAQLALQRQTGGTYPPWGDVLLPFFSLSSQGRIGSAFQRLGSQ